MIYLSTVFIITFLTSFVFRILNTVAFEAREICGHFNSWYPFITLLSLLQVMRMSTYGKIQYLWYLIALITYSNFP